MAGAGLPAGACDCHAHIFGPLDRFPFVEGRSYTPPERLATEYRAMLDRLGLERGIIVQPTVYGTDNGATLAALGNGLRGVAVVRPDISDRELSDFAERGIRGVRMTDYPGGVSLAHLETMADRLRGSGWHIQLFANFSERPDLCDRIRALGVSVVIDHLGLISSERGTADPAFSMIAGLLRDGLCWVKLSGPYLSSRQPLPYSDVAPIARGFVDACAERLVWGTDWPHPAAGANPPDDADLLALLGRWAPDPAVCKRILVHNPATLYDFDQP